MGQLKITLVKSKYGRLPNQRATLSALGLRKINHSVIQKDCDTIRGMIRTVSHLITYEEV